MLEWDDGEIIYRSGTRIELRVDGEFGSGSKEDTR